MKQSLSFVLALIGVANSASITQVWLPETTITGINEDGDTVNYGTLSGLSKWQRYGYGAEAGLDLVLVLTATSPSGAGAATELT